MFVSSVKEFRRERRGRAEKRGILLQNKTPTGGEMCSAAADGTIGGVKSSSRGDYCWKRDGHHSTRPIKLSFKGSLHTKYTEKNKKQNKQSSPSWVLSHDLFLPGFCSLGMCFVLGMKFAFISKWSFIWIWSLFHLRSPGPVLPWLLALVLVSTSSWGKPPAL